MVPTSNSNLRGGERVDLFMSVNLFGQKGKFRNHRLALEFGHPVYQSLNGPQLGVGLQGIIGWQKEF